MTEHEKSKKYFTVLSQPISVNKLWRIYPNVIGDMLCIFCEPREVCQWNAIRELKLDMITTVILIRPWLNGTKDFERNENSQ